MLTICIILGIRRTQILPFLHSDTITINTTSTINTNNTINNSNSSNNSNYHSSNYHINPISNSPRLILRAGEAGSVTPLVTGSDEGEVGGVKVKLSTTATGLTEVTSLTATSLTGRAIKVIGMVTRVTAEVTAVRERGGNRGGADTAAPAGNQPSTRSTGWLGAVFSLTVNPSMSEEEEEEEVVVVVVVVVEVVVTREGWAAAGRGAGRASW